MMVAAIGPIEQQAQASVTGLLIVSYTGLDKAVLQWEDTLPVASTTEFRIYQVGSPDVLLGALLDPDLRIFTVTGLSESTAYQFYVVASDGAGGDIQSNTVTATTGTSVAGEARFIKNGPQIFGQLAKIGIQYSGTQTYPVLGVAGAGTITYAFDGGRTTSPLTLITATDAIRFRIGPSGAGPVTASVTFSHAVKDVLIELGSMETADKCVNNMNPPALSVYSETGANYLPLLDNGRVDSCGTTNVNSGERFFYMFGDIPAGGTVSFEVDDATTDGVMFLFEVSAIG